MRFAALRSSMEPWLRPRFPASSSPAAASPASRRAWPCARSSASPSLDIALLCREDRFEYRPLAVLEPFEGAPAWSMKLERFAADQDVRLVVDALAGVDPDRHVAITAYSGRLSYDALLVCVGARPVRALPGAITFRGGRDAAAVRAALDAVQPGEAATIAFAVPFGAFWTLPLYELAILAAARLQTRGTRAQVVITSPEGAPLEAFGTAASTAVAQLLDAHGIEFTSHARAVTADAGELELDDGRRIATAAVVTPPRPRRPARRRNPPGQRRLHRRRRARARAGRRRRLRRGRRHHLPAQAGRPGHAAGRRGRRGHARRTRRTHRSAPVRAGPQGRPLHRPRARIPARDGWAGAGSEPRPYSMWWPPSKIAGRHLAPYLATRAGAPRAPEVRPERDAIAVSIDVPRAVRAVSSALDVSAVPPA